MRILVFHIHSVQEGSYFSQFFFNCVVRVKYKLTGKKVYIGSKSAVIIHRRVDIQSIFKTYFIVFLSMPRGDMDTSCPGLKCHKRCEYQHTVTFDKGMPAF